MDRASHSAGTSHAGMLPSTQPHGSLTSTSTLRARSSGQQMDNSYGRIVLRRKDQRAVEEVRI